MYNKTEYFITKHEPCSKCDGKGYYEPFFANQDTICPKCLGEGIEVSQVNLVDVLKENLSICVDKGWDSDIKISISFADIELHSDTMYISECRDNYEY